MQRAGRLTGAALVSAAKGLPKTQLRRMSSFLVDPAFIIERSPRVLDSSWHMPSAGKSAAKEFEERRIPGARFFDIEAASDHDSGLPHTLPSAEQFEVYMRSLGVAKDDEVVVYDSSGLFSAARVWWMVRYFSSNACYVLDGGLPRWVSEGHPTESGPPSSPALPDGSEPFSADCCGSSAEVRSHEDVLAQSSALVSGGVGAIVDARSGVRFEGSVEEPRAGMRKGCIPGSINVPFSALLEADGRVKGRDEVRGIFQAAGLDLDAGAAPITTTCGSGVTACILTLALEEHCGLNSAVYDGSWSEWGLAANGSPVRHIHAERSGS